MAARKPRCTHVIEGVGACMKLAVQRVVKPAQGMVTHRCGEHKITKAEAKREKWSLFDVA